MMRWRRSARIAFLVAVESVESREESLFIGEAEAVINADLRLDVLRGLAVAVIQTYLGRLEPHVLILALGRRRFTSYPLLPQISALLSSESLPLLTRSAMALAMAAVKYLRPPAFLSGSNSGFSFTRDRTVG